MNQYICTSRPRTPYTRSSLGTLAPLAGDERYLVKLASSADEVESALRLRHEVFVRELAAGLEDHSDRESDEHDPDCDHLIAINRATGETIGTYRLKSAETTARADRFYSNSEFTLESLPAAVLANGIEIGRACVAAEHRSTRAIFLLWRALARRMRDTGKRYFFGCCSIFTRDPSDGEAAFRQLEDGAFIHERFRVEPRNPLSSVGKIEVDDRQIKLPGLFEMYLRVGARVCGRPAYDAEFGTVDFFVVFDLEAMAPKYRRMFLD